MSIWTRLRTVSVNFRSSLTLLLSALTGGLHSQCPTGEKCAHLEPSCFDHGYGYCRCPESIPPEQCCCQAEVWILYPTSSRAYTIQAATGVPPSCVLSSPLACIQMTTTFHGKIGTFEEFCEHLQPYCINNGPALFCCNVL